MAINLYENERACNGTARCIKRAYVFMSRARRNRWTKQLSRNALHEVVSKLAEDSHKGINRRRRKSDRRGSARKLSGAIMQRGDARESVLPLSVCLSFSLVRWALGAYVREGTTYHWLYRDVSFCSTRGGIVNSWKLRKSGNRATSHAPETDIARKLFVRSFVKQARTIANS